MLAALLSSLLPLCAGAARDTGAGRDTGAAPKSTVIYVVRRGWHIDVGFAAADMQAPLNSIAGQFPRVRYLLFGFGDRRYLLAKNRNAPVLLAALWPGRGMILATGIGSSPQEAFGAAHVAALAVTQEQMRNAQAFVWRSLEGHSTDQEGQSTHTDHAAVQPYATGPYEGSLYFAAAPRYSALHTCNTWAAQSLAAAALPIRSAGVLFAGQLWSQVRRLEKNQLAGGLQSSDQLHGGLDPSWHTTVVPEF
jgi:hypothetical protein